MLIISYPAERKLKASTTTRRTERCVRPYLIKPLAELPDATPEDLHCHVSPCSKEKQFSKIYYKPCKSGAKPNNQHYPNYYHYFNSFVGKCAFNLGEVPLASKLKGITVTELESFYMKQFPYFWEKKAAKSSKVLKMIIVAEVGFQESGFYYIINNKAGKSR
jgi:hypothetical protein